MEYPAETLLPQFVENPKLEFEALVTVAENLKSRHGDWHVAWGDLFRIQRRPEMIDLLGLPFDDRQPSLPCVAAPGSAGRRVHAVLLAVDPHSVRGRSQPALRPGRHQLHGRLRVWPEDSERQRAQLRPERRSRFAPLLRSGAACCRSASSSPTCSTGPTCWPAPSWCIIRASRRWKTWRSNSPASPLPPACSAGAPASSIARPGCARSPGCARPCRTTGSRPAGGRSFCARIRNCRRIPCRASSACRSPGSQQRDGDNDKHRRKRHARIGS